MKFTRCDICNTEAAKTAPFYEQIYTDGKYLCINITVSRKSVVDGQSYTHHIDICYSCTKKLIDKYFA